MGILRTKTIEPATGSTLTLGASGDTITVSSDSIKANTFKDAGGNTLFTSDGAGTLSSVNSALAPGGPILISTHTASGSSSVDITSGIDSTYDEYMFVFTDINPATNNVSFQFDTSTDGGSNYGMTKTTTVFQTEHQESDAYAGMQYRASQDLAQSASDQILCYSLGNASDESAAGVLHLFSPSSTTYVKHFYSRTCYTSGSDSLWTLHVAGYINDTNDIDAVQFMMSSGNFDGVIQMYGIA